MIKRGKFSVEAKDFGHPYWDIFRSKPFYCQDFATKYSEIIEKQAEQFRASECCFTHIVGLPRKYGKLHPLYDYEGQLIKDEEKYRHRYILKATGLGITELKLRRYAWKSLSSDEFVNNHGCVVTGPRIDLAINIIDRIKALFTVPFSTKNTAVYLGKVKVEAFPSHHLDAMRGLNPDFVYNDEADFFPPKEQENVRSLSERYIAKSNPEIDFVSTPNLPGGLCEKIDKEKKSLYHRRYLPYKVGIGKIFTPDEIKRAKASPSFEREYNLKYGYGVGNIFPHEFVEACTSSYDLVLRDGSNRILSVDPAYGSSKFAIVGLEEVDQMLYVMEARQYDRPSPSAMLQLVSRLGREYPTVIVDSAHPGLIRDLRQEGIDAYAINFRKELSRMTSVAADVVKNRSIRIHPTYSELIQQLNAAVFNDRGHPDKKTLSFDLGDALIAGTYYLRGGDQLLIAKG